MFTGTFFGAQLTMTMTLKPRLVATTAKFSAG